jgi:quercetin dioxygenase-like cupin family protein
MKTLLPLALLACAFAAAAEEPPAPARHLLLEKGVALPSPNVQARLIRVQFPPHYKTPLHTHEGPGPRYVVNGRIKVEDAGKTAEFGPGEVFWESGSEMAVENIGGGEAEIIIFEMAPGK